MNFKKFLKGPTTYFNAVDGGTTLSLTSELGVDPDDIIIMLKQSGVNITQHSGDKHTFYIERMNIKGMDHKGILKTALLKLYNKLEIHSNGIIAYENYDLKKLTISTVDDDVNVDFSKPKKKKKKAT